MAEPVLDIDEPWEVALVAGKFTAACTAVTGSVSATCHALTVEQKPRSTLDYAVEGIRAWITSTLSDRSAAVGAKAQDVLHAALCDTNDITWTDHDSGAQIRRCGSSAPPVTNLQNDP
ncbi:MAG: hypothetical protein HOQ24_04955 [Mycobacteriaceae bacterium]|nr:hypothetical protein [Mycobacteriaceae bacterium]